MWLDNNQSSYLSGVCPAGSYPLRCGLPAHSGHWHGNHAGENHHHQEGINHICAGKLWNCKDGHSNGNVLFKYELSLDPLHQAIYVPADDLTDPAPATTFAHLDATTVLSRAIAELGIYPAVDPLDSTSRIMDPNIVGIEHYEIARNVQKILQVWDLIIFL